MRLSVITPPTPVVTWEQADRHLKLDGDTSQQSEVEALISAATEHLDGPAGGWLGRAIGTQVVEARPDVFRDAMVLPFPPVTEIVSVKYLDAAGVEQTVMSTEYEQRGALLGAAFGKRWPAVARHPEAVRIRYRVGYAQVPAPIKHAILLMVGDMHRFRDTVAAAGAVKVPMSTSVENLLEPFRVFS